MRLLWMSNFTVALVPKWISVALLFPLQKKIFGRENVWKVITGFRIYRVQRMAWQPVISQTPVLAIWFYNTLLPVNGKSVAHGK